MKNEEQLEERDEDFLDVFEERLFFECTFSDFS